MQDAGTGNGCQNIDCDADRGAKGPCNVGEDLLCHIIMWADIEHIEGTIPVKGEIKACRQQAAASIETCAEKVTSG